MIGSAARKEPGSHARPVFRSATAIVAAIFLCCAGAPKTAEAVDNPTVTGPIAGGLRGHALWDSWYDLADIGYMEEEYFISGNARTSPSSPTTAPYTTRIIVTRPIDAADFNGTVLFDWVNVTAQFENPVDILETHELLHRHLPCPALFVRRRRRRAAEPRRCHRRRCCACATGCPTNPIA